MNGESSHSRVALAGWVGVLLIATVLIHLMAGLTTGLSIGLMSSATDFAARVRENDIRWLPYWRFCSYGVTIAAVLYYARHLRAGPVGQVRQVRQDEQVETNALDMQRVVLSLPVVVGFASFAAWCVSPLFFVLLTLASFGRWSSELMSQHVLSPLVNGTFAAATTYLFADWLFRTRVNSLVFPDGQVRNVPGAWVLSVRGRLVVFLAAVAFIPMFTMLGLAQSAEDRFALGIDAAELFRSLAIGSLGVFVVYGVLGLVLTMLLAQTLTRPLESVREALERVERGDMDGRLVVQSVDEIGAVQAGVNRLAIGLSENERVLAAFGRVVDPAVRDHLLSGAIESGGQQAEVTVMFCDLRGSTRLAESESAEETVRTLNSFFDLVDTAVRDAGGFVDKFIGDAALAVFGLFDEESKQGDGASEAFVCADTIRRRMEILNDERRSVGHRELSFSMSVHTGPVLAGTTGSRERFEFTVIGDTVNVAARLQEVAKRRNADLVASSASCDAAAKNDGVRPIGTEEEVTVRGRETAVKVVTIEKNQPNVTVV